MAIESLPLLPVVVMPVSSSSCVKNLIRYQVSAIHELAWERNSITLLQCTIMNLYGRPSPPKIQESQIDQQVQSWSKDQLQDRIASKGMARPNSRRFSFPS